jgi:hypothetical protein
MKAKSNAQVGRFEGSTFVRGCRGKAECFSSSSNEKEKNSLSNGLQEVSSIPQDVLMDTLAHVDGFLHQYSQNEMAQYLDLPLEKITFPDTAKLIRTEATKRFVQDYERFWVFVDSSKGGSVLTDSIKLRSVEELKTLLMIS